ncbi:MAG TPA: phospholipase D-like domain-containing protein [Ktedonobacteraceae bacterium]|nr:phospholipase D-like domain-containing protein [Ktedonobacteraceae bacterium]
MTTVQTVDNALQQLLATAKNFPGASLDICSGYISTNGISSLRAMFTSARSVRAVVDLNPTNRLNAFRMLRSFGAQVYIYVAPPRTIFHPKIYFGALETQVWALIGSSNLTESGMATNVEHNLFITGQRHTEPFSSLEARIESFIKQSYPFDRELEKSLLEVERKMVRDPQTNKYDAYLLASGIKPKEKLELTIPAEVQRAALETLFKFARSTRLEYAYQMLLLLVMLNRSDANGWFSVNETARCFIAFYRMCREAGLPPEKRRGSKLAVVDNPNARLAEIAEMIKTRPFPRFEREGLLGLSDNDQYFVINPALLEGLNAEVREALKELAIKRMGEHFGEDIMNIEAMAVIAIQKKSL